MLKVQENNTNILALLQACVNGEATSRNLYFARAMFWRNVGLTKLADYYERQSQEDHCQLSADRLLFLGGRLSVSPSAVPLALNDPITEQYRQDLAVETELAENYADSIKVTEAAGDYVTAMIWKQVLQGTQEHCAYLEQELRQIQLMGEDQYLSTWR